MRRPRAAAEACRAVGREVWLKPFDVSDRSEAKTALEAMLEELGGPHSGGCQRRITRDGLFAMMADDQWDEVLAVGLGGFW